MVGARRPAFVLLMHRALKIPILQRRKVMMRARKYLESSVTLPLTLRVCRMRFMLTTANITDRAGSLEAFCVHKENLRDVQNVLVDGGYSGEQFAGLVQELLGASVEVAKRNELHTFEVIPQRWVVERSFAWLEKWRRLWKTVKEKSIQVYKWSYSLSSFY